MDAGIQLVAKAHDETLQIIQELSKRQYDILNGGYLEDTNVMNPKCPNSLAFEINNLGSESVAEMNALWFLATDLFHVVSNIAKARVARLIVGVVILAAILVAFQWFYMDLLYTDCHWEQQYICS
jgi:hypothetical protein